MKQQADRTKVQGEGDYDAGRRYNKATRDFVQQHGAPDADDAEPQDAREAADLVAAEREALRHSKGEALADRGSTAAPRGGGKPAERRKPKST